jgi:membrane protease YdiL (CAAX protease family)
MYDNDSKGISYSAGFFMLIAFAIAGIFLAAQINTQIWFAMTGKNYAQSLSGTPDPADGLAYKIIQSVNSIVAYLLPTFLIAQLLHKRPAKLLGFTSSITKRQIGMVVLISAAALFVGSALGYLNHQIPIPSSWKIQFDKMETDYNQQAQAVLGLKNKGDFIFALVVMGFLPALCEETLFRGGLQNFLYRSTGKAWLAIILASVIFSAAHWEFYGFLYRFFLAVVLGSIYYYSGKIWLNILAHFLNNAVVISVYYVAVRQGKPMTETASDANAYYWGLIALPVLIGLFLLFKRESVRVKLNY